MLNFRKLRQDLSPTVIKSGRELHEKEMVVSAKIESLDAESLKVSAHVLGVYDNTYESEIEMSRLSSEIIDSNCDCPHEYDCPHLAALLFYLEDHLDALVVGYSKETDLSELARVDETEKEELLETFKKSEDKQLQLDGIKYQKELSKDYHDAARIFRRSPFFLPREHLVEDKAELALLFNPSSQGVTSHAHDVQVMLRLPRRSKPLAIPNIKEFFDSVRYHEPLLIGGRRYFFTNRSFDAASTELMSILLDSAKYYRDESERHQRTAILDHDVFGALLARAYDFGIEGSSISLTQNMPCLYNGSLENPLLFSPVLARPRFILEFFAAPHPKIILKPLIIIGDGNTVDPDDANLFECTRPGMIHANVYYRFSKHITRAHLQNLPIIRNMTIPEPLFGTFVENALPELQSCAEVHNLEILEEFVTIPYVNPVEARCNMTYGNGELAATLFFRYGHHELPAAHDKMSFEEMATFVTPDGVIARNIAEEQSLLHDVFEDFIYDAKEGAFLAKSKKKIVEFMTETIPANQHRIEFRCPENLLNQFIYDDTSFSLSLSNNSNIATYDVTLETDGPLSNVPLALLIECIMSNKTYIELDRRRRTQKGDDEGTKLPKILVYDLKKLRPIIELLDEIGIISLASHTAERPLWSLVSLDFERIKELPLTFSVSTTLEELQQQMLGKKEISTSGIPETMTAILRAYQIDGVNWLERLRSMYLNGILADDMGLGKTVQALVTLAQNNIKNPQALSLIICPTSLTYNWLEEFRKFNPSMNVLLVDGTPEQRKKLLTSMSDYNVIITSYGLIQKDIDIYKKVLFSYIILDEAQHIKNPSTLNAKSVKQLSATHKLILTGTPVENSLDELWSLFDFLMPGLLGSYSRFNEKYLRGDGEGRESSLKALNTKVAPFILRRMKEDVLDDLPSLSQIHYHCRLTTTQQELYNSYVVSARDELTKLVDKEGFNKVQIHVLATLTRLKQICCHPAIFAKEHAEKNDSAKYEMLFELLQTLIQGGHKTVIFSQYTKMLTILREDLTKLGIPFAYLDGTSKNRVNIVNKFNRDATVPVFLVSLRAGGTGLNITGADTVIHYDMWWNPAVEEQATDRVHRMGQQRNVSAYKLITLGTVEEKIIELQNRKRLLVEKVITDDDMIAKLSWDDVLELLQT